MIQHWIESTIATQLSVLAFNVPFQPFLKRRMNEESLAKQEESVKKQEAMKRGVFSQNLNNHGWCDDCH